jgi:hypothetical protein
MVETKKQKSQLKAVKKVLDKDLKKTARDGLSLAYRELGLNGVAKEIKAGRNVRGNTEYGVVMGVHNKLGPRYDLSTKKIVPMTKRQREMEHKWIDNANGLLKMAGEKPLDKSSLIKKLRAKDREFAKKVKKR